MNVNLDRVNIFIEGLYHIDVYVINRQVTALVLTNTETENLCTMCDILEDLPSGRDNLKELVMNENQPCIGLSNLYII